MVKEHAAGGAGRSLGAYFKNAMAQGLADLKAAPSYSTSRRNPG